MRSAVSTAAALTFIRSWATNGRSLGTIGKNAVDRTRSRHSQAVPTTGQLVAQLLRRQSGYWYVLHGPALCSRHATRVTHTGWRPRAGSHGAVRLETW